MNIAAWLIAMVGPMVARVLTTLGLSVVVMTGVTLSVSALKSVVLSHIGGFPLAAVQLLGLFGAWEALGMMFGALTFAVAWHTTAGAWRLAKT
jgi:Protein of unknown function (DUF2523)